MVGPFALGMGLSFLGWVPLLCGFNGKPRWEAPCLGLVWFLSFAGGGGGTCTGGALQKRNDAARLRLTPAGLDPSPPGAPWGSPGAASRLIEPVAGEAVRGAGILG